jgi:hypothetical protein
MELRDFFGGVRGPLETEWQSISKSEAALNIELWTMLRDIVTQAARFMIIQHFNMYNGFG